jgi:NhaA family Na+:H+ antiporter
MTKATCGLFADVWEHIGNSWEVTHRFNTGLEFDRLSDVTRDARHSRVHLPVVSIRSLQMLQKALCRPKAVALDLTLKMQDRQQEGCSPLLKALLDQVRDSLSPAQVAQAEALLKAREFGLRPVDKSPPQPPLIGNADDSDAESTTSEALMERAPGMEGMDVTVCLLPDLDVSKSPLVAFARLENLWSLPVEGASGTVRYAFLVVASSETGDSARLGDQVARSFATAMMDEDFYREVRVCKDEKQLHEAFDVYLGSLTIVPTVYLEKANEKTDPQGAAHLSDYLLSDSLVQGVQRIIARVRNMQKVDSKLKLHHQRKRGDEHVVELRRKFFVEVDELTSALSLWRVTHRLRQGLELDVMCSMRRPHLPRVSVSALAHVRRLMTPASVALDVVAASPQEGIDSTVCQLCRAGLPQAAVDHITDALLQRATSDAYAVGGTNENDQESGVKRARDLDCGELMQPYTSDEAIHVLVVSSKHIPSGHGIVGAFMRFASPLGVHFASFDTPIRFLLVFAGPQKSEGLLAALGDSLAALTIDEDLMGDLSRAKDVESFTGAVDNCLSDLVVFPHAHVSASIHDALGRRHQYDSESSCEELDSTTKPRSDTEINESSFDAPEASHTSKDMSHKKSLMSMSSVESEKEEPAEPKTAVEKVKAAFQHMMGIALKYSLPLVFGVLTALIWCNVDEEGYDHFIHIKLWKNAELFGHELTLHFLVNDIFMCFFFGLAIKEVTEAVLPGGSLSPIWRAANPLCATVGGVVGPIVAYIIAVLVLDAFGVFDREMCFDDVSADDGAHRLLGEMLRSLGGQASNAGSGTKSPCDLSALIKGWGVPTATDISLAWMFALVVFGAGHPTINFLLLLAIVDDAMGMMIIAVAYPNPEKPLDPPWLALVFAGTAVAMIFRYFNFRHWQWYIFVAGPIAWMGLLKAHLHPALALAVVVPCLPANHIRPKVNKTERRISVNSTSSAPEVALAVDCVRRDSFSSFASEDDIRSDGEPKPLLAEEDPNWQSANEVAGSIADVPDETRAKAASRAAAILEHIRHAPLHEFEHTMKLPVDLGMFFFGLMNAGVKLDSFGGITYSVVFALIVGKTLGIAGFGLFAVKLGFALPNGVSVVDLFAVSALGGIGLTVALFVANEAFTDPGLQGQAKMGAVISVSSAAVAWAIKFFGDYGRIADDESLISESISDDASEDSDIESLKSVEKDDKEAEDWIDEALLDDILQTLWTQRRYSKHGTVLPLTPTGGSRRSISKASVGSTRRESKRHSNRAINPDSMLVARSASKQSAVPQFGGRAINPDSMLVARSASKQSAVPTPQAAWMSSMAMPSMPSMARAMSKERRGSAASRESADSTKSRAVSVDTEDLEQANPDRGWALRKQAAQPEEPEQIPTSPEGIESSLRSLSCSPRSVT